MGESQEEAKAIYALGNSGTRELLIINLAYSIYKPVLLDLTTMLLLEPSPPITYVPFHHILDKM